MDRAEETYGLLELVGKRQLFARLQQVAARRTLMGGQWLIHGLADTLVMAETTSHHHHTLIVAITLG